MSRMVSIQLSGRNLEDKDLFSKSDPFFRICRLGSQGKLLYVSEYISDTLNPEWKEFEKSEEELFGGNREEKIKIEVFDDDGPGDTENVRRAEFIGEGTYSNKELQVAFSKNSPLKVCKYLEFQW